MRRFPASVNAPASWPNSSDSSSEGLIAAQLSLTRGWSQRDERKCSRSAISSLPVPRSPTISNGRFRSAARETCSSVSRNVPDSPIRGCSSRFIRRLCGSYSACLHYPAIAPRCRAWRGAYKESLFDPATWCGSCSSFFKPAGSRRFCQNSAMVKAKTLYVCGECGASQPKWSGQCPDCGAWNSLSESAPPAAGGPRQRSQSWTGEASAEVVRLGAVQAEDTPRFSSGLTELDRVLGGGLVPGSVILIGGDPGIGKSTLLLQSQAAVATE